MNASNEEQLANALPYHYIFRYADDIFNAPPDLRFTLTKAIAAIYHHALPLEDTAVYHTYPSGEINYSIPPKYITFLDLCITRCPLHHRIVTDLYQKAKLFPFAAVGIDIALSNTPTESFANVFASEALRFYAACSHYDSFFKHLFAYMNQFIDKGYKRQLLTSSLIRVFKRHPNGKYGNHPTDWVRKLIELTRKHNYYRQAPKYRTPAMAAVNFAKLAHASSIKQASSASSTAVS